MFNQVLALLDGSALAESTLPHIATLARAFGSEVTLLHVLDSTRLDQSGGEVDLLHWQLRNAEATAYLTSKQAQLEAHGLNARAVTLEGHMVERVIEYIRNRAIDCVVLSSHGQGGVNDWGLGSAANGILLRAPTSKLIVRVRGPHLQDPAPSSYRSILVPLDGSWRAECVLPVVTTLAQKLDAQLVMAHAVAKPEMARRMPLTDEDIRLANQVVRRNHQEADHYFEELRTRVPAPFDVNIVEGANTIGALHQLTQRVAPDLVVLSAHGLSGRLEWSYGSIAHSFITYGQTPLLIIHDSAAPASRANNKETGISNPRQHEIPHHA